jgi:hypothetical protein
MNARINGFCESCELDQAYTPAREIGQAFAPARLLHPADIHEEPERAPFIRPLGVLRVYKTVHPELQRLLERLQTSTSRNGKRRHDSACFRCRKPFPRPRIQVDCRLQAVLFLHC